MQRRKKWRKRKKSVYCWWKEDVHMGYQAKSANTRTRSCVTDFAILVPVICTELDAVMVRSATTCTHYYVKIQLNWGRVTVKAVHTTTWNIQKSRCRKMKPPVEANRKPTLQGKMQIPVEGTRTKVHTLSLIGMSSTEKNLVNMVSKATEEMIEISHTNLIVHIIF